MTPLFCLLWFFFTILEQLEDLFHEEIFMHILRFLEALIREFALEVFNDLNEMLDFLDT